MRVEGYVYVVTNPAMPGLVKIERTTQSDPLTRVSSLFSTSVPVPFELEYAAAISDDPARVEAALHEAFAPQRLHPKREFFALEPRQVIAVLRLLDIEDVTEKARADVETERSQEDRDSLERVWRRPNLNFAELGVPQGSVLTYWNDDTVRVEVVDERRVRVVELPDGEYPHVTARDEPRYLSPLTAELIGDGVRVRPTGYWRVADGRSLLELYDEKHGPRE